MRKYFYFVATDPMAWVNEKGNARSPVRPDQVKGQTRELAREVKRNWSSPEQKTVICKFDRKPPYKFLGVVS